jgi:predicted ATPase/DNA-binding SARP family transcriptional activator
MEYRVLGSLDVRDGDRSLPVASTKQRALLALLLLNANRVVSRDRLIDGLWGEQPPETAVTSLQVYVSRLRKLLPPDTLLTRPPGYLLELEPEELDLYRFEQLLVEGRKALAHAEPERAAGVLQDALALWRGPALAEFAFESFAQAEIGRLEDLRLAAVEERIEADLRLGRHTDVVGELEALIAENPHRERLRSELILALYRSGRHPEALEAYGDARARLDEIGLEPSPQLRELQRRILRHDPGLAAPGAEVAEATALPRTPNALLGRHPELRELRALLLRGDVRLIVLTGAGGTGKTRLAIEAAREVASFFADGAVFVPLAPLRDPDLVVQTIARSIDVGDVPGQDPAETLAEALRHRELILLLDNAEHLPAAAPAYVELLSRAPRLTLLVTSRTVLHLPHENVYPVHPLADDAATALFRERAREVEPRFRPDDRDNQAIELICRRLDNLPLAIELVASRARMLRPAELLAWLQPRLPLLAGGPRDLPARQQTLRATLAWSVDLLAENERRDLCRLSVFAGGWTREAAAFVCDARDERLATLAEHNLVDRASDSSRYSMLETIREFADEQLEHSGEAEEMRRRHVEFFVAVAESANLCVEALGRGLQRHDLVLPEKPNLSAALAWSGEADPELGLRLGVALENYWATSAPFEGRRRIEELLARAPDAPANLRARALRVLGGMTDLTGESEKARAIYEQSLSVFREDGDDAGAAMMVYRIGSAFFNAGNLHDARPLIEESLEAFTRAGYEVGECMALGSLGSLDALDGDVRRARKLLERSARLAHEIGFVWFEAHMLGHIGELLLNQGEPQLAEAWSAEALALSHRIGDRQNTIMRLAVLASAAAERGDVERAGKLWGAIEAEESRGRIGAWERNRGEYEQRLPSSDDPAFDRGRQMGRALSLDEAVDEALASRRPDVVSLETAPSANRD